jgi:hypothetical protein
MTIDKRIGKVLRKDDKGMITSKMVVLTNGSTGDIELTIQVDDFEEEEFVEALKEAREAYNEDSANDAGWEYDFLMDAVKEKLQEYGFKFTVVSSEVEQYTV